ncbi:MAG: hypothetical protein MI892_06195 [Desulfobacterales bacterium]|nr:hypothetical protein [Desulfobacterales bacterium]
MREFDSSYEICVQNVKSQTVGHAIQYALCILLLLYTTWLLGFSHLFAIKISSMAISYADTGSFVPETAAAFSQKMRLMPFSGTNKPMR